ncbi:MAG: BREX-1 system adenine-specific DNA-methyltransferase PglX [Acidobacteriota bacterium]
MDRTKLKNYAPQARRDFIQAVTDRAAFYGLAPNKIEAITEQGDTTIIGGKAFPRSVAEKRRALEERIKRQGFEQVMEAVAYTWFNRLVALRFMELHGYLDHGYRVLSHPEGKATPEILEHAEHVELPGLDRNKAIEMKLDPSRETELYRALLIAQCNALHAAMPFLFERIDDETELLLPNNLLHSDSLIRKLVNEIDEEDWQQVEIIGWLYQFYISEKKDQVIGKVVKSEDIPAATQLFTPNWIVKYMVQNSLGRMWLATYPNSALRSKMEYYIEPAEQTEEVKAQLAAITPASIDPETITILDPACGSGHILVEAYDLLKEIYLERGYRMRDIPRLILSKNLYGLDIDDRAAQLAGLALTTKYTKYAKKSKEDAEAPVRLNVFAIQESAALNAAEIADALINVKSKPRAVPIVGDDRLWNDLSAQPALMMQSDSTASDNASREDVIELLELFKQGKTLGSLITVAEALAARLPVIAKTVEENLQSGDLYAREAASTLLPFVRQAEVLARKYDCVIANPPYMGSKYMTPALRGFSNQFYVDSGTDLFSMFLRRMSCLVAPNKYIGVMTPFNWMFITSYEDIRAWIIHEMSLISLVQPEIHAFFDSAYVSICAFVLMNSQSSLIADFIDLSAFYGDSLQPIKTLEAIRDPLCNWKYRVCPKEFAKIPSSPFAYQLSRQFFDVFSSSSSIGKHADVKEGLNTGDNDLFFRMWAEVDIERIAFKCASGAEAISSDRKWFPCNRGGAFRRWYGNNEFVIDWKNDGKALKSFRDKQGKLLSSIRNESYYFKSGITWSGVSSGGFNARFFEEGFLFNSVGRSLFPHNHLTYTLGFLNSIMSDRLLRVLAPTIHFSVGTIANLPFNYPSNDLLQQIESNVDRLIDLARNEWNGRETSWDFQTFPLLRSDIKAATVEESFRNWEAHCNANIRRMQELETENNRLFIEAYGLEDELTPQVPEDQITLARADRESDIKRLISYAVGCMMGRYSLDRPGLIYAHSGNKDFDRIYHLTDEDASNAEKNQSVLSLSSVVKPSFPPDADGIIPVMEAEWFADDAANRFVEFIRVAWPEAHLEENLRFIDESLGQTIRRYLAASFFKYHLKTYKKRPIYWLFSSGKLRAFQCLVYLHRYNEGTLARMRTEYVIPLQGKIAARIEHLSSDIDKAASTSHRRKIEKEQDTLRKQQAELQAFDEKLRHYADKRISLDLDDGVKVNYGKFGDLLAEVKAVHETHETHEKD